MASCSGIDLDCCPIGEDCPRVIGRRGVQMGPFFGELLDGFDIGAFITADGIQKGSEARLGGIGDKKWVEKWRQCPL